MNEQRAGELIAAMIEQTAALNRLAESNESLAAMLYQSLAFESETELPSANYLSGKAKG